jgi:phage host-nuclease inhibitor protein Gam
MLAFADDLVLMAPSPEELQKLTDQLVAFCKANSLEINVGKTQAMYVNCTGTINIYN